MPENVSGIRGKEADNRFQQSGLAGTIRSDNAEHLARARGESYAINGTLLAVPFRQIDDAQWRDRVLADGNSAESME